MKEKRVFRKVLDNGITVLLKRRNTVSASFGIGVRFGTAHHPAAHFLEHLPFRGTQTRSYRDINRLAARWGGDFDAFTDFFSTLFLTKVLTPHAYEALDLLCDMISKPSLLPSEVDYERNVVLEEYREESERPHQVLTDRIYRNVYHGNPLERAVLDDANIIEALSYDELVKTYRANYAPPQLIIIGVGPIRRDAFLETITKHFPKRSRKKNGGGDAPRFHAVHAASSSGRIIISKPSLKQVHLMVGFKAVPRTHHDFYALRLFSSIMGGNTDSRLFEEAREKRGFIYRVSSHFDTTRSSWHQKSKADCTAQHGILRIHTTFSPKNLGHVEKIFRKELRRLATDGISEEELQIHKEHLINNHRLALLGTFRYMRLLFAAEVNHSIKEFHAFDEKISAVTPSDIERIAQTYCAPHKGLWVILHPM